MTVEVGAIDLGSIATSAGVIKHLAEIAQERNGMALSMLDMLKLEALLVGIEVIAGSIENQIENLEGGGNVSEE